MARLESQAKMGFYPTPPQVVNQIKALLKIEPGARMIDTCCGAGEALGEIASGSDCATFGVELDRERSREAKTKLGEVVWGDALHELVCSQAGFSLLYLNPPYDWDGEGNRLEVLFLKQHWAYLQTGGVLIYIVPVTIIGQVVNFLESRAKEVRVLSFPADLYPTFKQVVVLAEKGRPKKEEKEAIRNTLERVASLAATEPHVIPERVLSTADCQKHWNIPRAVKETVVFRSVRFDPEDAMEAVQNSRVWQTAASAILPPLEAAKLNPLMPLREGHLAMLLASGMMDGEVVGENGERLVVKGSVRKVVNETCEVDEESCRWIQTDQYKITVRAIRFDLLEIVDIE